MSYTQEQIDRANQVDLEQFLRSHGEQVTKSGNEYRWKRHDSLTIQGNKWFRHSQSKGGYPVEFVMEFFGKTFPEAVSLLIGEAPAHNGAAAAPSADFRLPPRNRYAAAAMAYLRQRNIPEELVQEFCKEGLIYEDARHHNIVFVGKDEIGIPRYAHCKGTEGSFRMDVQGSDKSHNFAYRSDGKSLFVFEAPIDLMSFIALYPNDWKMRNYLSLGGVGAKALEGFLSERKDIETVYICTDSDKAGNDAVNRLLESIPESMTVIRLIPCEKDWNEVLKQKDKLPDGKYISRRIMLRGESEKKAVPMIRMSEVQQTEVEWLWYPYIPFGKLTIIQGNPGEGKTFFAMQLAAACTNRKFLPQMEPFEPFNMIFQTAEDGLGDTVKPRLLSAEADLERVLVIDDADNPLTLADERIENAIRENNARLVIIDPLQAFLGANVDMNRANEARDMTKKLGALAEKYKCAIILIGHMNKAGGNKAAYRGIGSIDFFAVARSVLLVGRIEGEPDLRAVVQIKNNLAAFGHSKAFRLTETGFEWIGDYEITADEVLGGIAPKVNKLEQAKKMLRELAKTSASVQSSEIFDMAEDLNISKRTLENAKKELEIKARRIGNSWYWDLDKVKPE